MAPVTINRTRAFKDANPPCSFPVEKLTEDILALSDAAVLVTYGNSIQYCTRSIVSVLGIRRECVMQEGWPYLFGLIHPGDKRILEKKMMPEIRKYYRNLAECERHHHTFNLTLRMRVEGCRYALITIENRPLLWTTKYWPTAYATVLRDISIFGDKGEAALSIYKHNAGKTYERVYQKKYSVGAGDFSARETEILRHIAHGLTSRQIAQQLSISPETVRNHRKKIMRKAACQSSYALTRMVLDGGII